MKLVIAEKPSVAQSIARVIGAAGRKDGYLEGNGYLVSWCIGHLVELSAPETYDERYSKWRLEDLPILPDSWLYQVSPGTKNQFGILKELMKRPDVESLVCATDAGREGELIFRLVYNQCHCKKPFERLWISSMEDAAIREGFRNLKLGTAYDNLYAAALCRERADWIVGMNATRLFSCLYGTTLAVGRVMTPTLGMAVMREAEILAFKPEIFYEVELQISGISAKSDRIKERSDAEKAAEICRNEGKAEVVSSVRREKTEKPPALYDLTSLQRDANRILGFTAQQTLDYTQSLYEKKLVTYPRTDSRYLTDDMAPALPEWLIKATRAFGLTDFYMDPYNEAQKNQISQVINSKKVSDHHAIIPTKTCADTDLSGLPSGEMRILMLIACRFLAAVSEPHRYAETKITLSCGGREYTSKGKEVLYEGWKRIERHFRPAAKDGKDVNVRQSLSEGIREGMTLPVQKTEVKEGKTTPPKRFTEDTMLSSMESAGAKELPAEAERKGLGTPATRAATIEKLVQKGFLTRRGDKKTKYLVPTDRGISLITVMPELIQSPTLTADWEQKLVLIERGEYDPSAFMQESEDMISTLIKTYEVVKGADVLMNGKKVMGACPHCGAEVMERQKGWFCSNKECRFVLWKDNRYFTKIGKHLTGQMVESFSGTDEFVSRTARARRPERRITLIFCSPPRTTAVRYSPWSLRREAAEMSERNEHEHSIRFITTDYEELFRIPDGGTVLVTFPDRQFAEKCSYIDDYHMKVGNSGYHICQYAEILKQNGGQCAPEPETELAKATWQLGHREYLMLERTDAGFRYEILTKDFLSRTQGQLDRPEWTMNQARDSRCRKRRLSAGLPEQKSGR